MSDRNAWWPTRIHPTGSAMRTPAIAKEIRNTSNAARIDGLVEQGSDCGMPIEPVAGHGELDFVLIDE